MAYLTLAAGLCVGCLITYFVASHDKADDRLAIKQAAYRSGYELGYADGEKEERKRWAPGPYRCASAERDARRKGFNDGVEYAGLRDRLAAELFGPGVVDD